MAGQPKSRHAMTQAKRPRTTRRVLDRDGRPAKMVSARQLGTNTSAVLRQVKKTGAVAIAKSGKPVAVALSPDQFVTLCVAYATRALRRF